jgi:hypothetical protein
VNLTTQSSCPTGACSSRCTTLRPTKEKAADTTADNNSGDSALNRKIAVRRPISAVERLALPARQDLPHSAGKQARLLRRQTYP